MLFIAAAIACGLAVPPVAVAPFRLLSSEKDIAFLEHGAAETMTADLRKLNVPVVERAQLQQALRELRTVADDTARAVAAGKVVGAKSVVVGSVQRAGQDVRLVARVVVVETGEIKEAATATGKLADIFSLQDKLTTALVGKAPQRKRAPRVQSYQQLGTALSATTNTTSLSTATTTSIVALAAPLDAILIDDPDFTYADTALSSLLLRVTSGDPAKGAALDDKVLALLAIVEDKQAASERRVRAGKMVIDSLFDARRFRATIAAAARVIAAGVPADPLDDVNEHAEAARVLSLLSLLHTDAGLSAADTYLTKHPAGSRRADVHKAVEEAIARRRSEGDRRKEFDDELNDNDTGDARAKAFRPCIAAKWSTLPTDMIVRCTRYLKRYGAETDDDGRDHMKSARAYVAWGYALRGDFSRAHKEADALERDMPGALANIGLDVVRRRWSLD